MPQRAGGVNRPQAAHPGAQRRDHEPGHGRGGDQHSGRAAGQRSGQQADQCQRVQAAAHGAYPGEPVPVRQPAAQRARHALAERVGGHDEARGGHRGVHGGDQQQRDADHPLRQPRADVRHRQPAQHRVAEQPPVGSRGFLDRAHRAPGRLRAQAVAGPRSRSALPAGTSTVKQPGGRAIAGPVALPLPATGTSPLMRRSRTGAPRRRRCRGAWERSLRRETGRAFPRRPTGKAGFLSTGCLGQLYSQGMTVPGARTGARLAELLAALSLASDLGMGQPIEHMLRQCLIALRLAERLGLSSADRAVVYYASLLAWVGCHVDAYEQAKWLGDDTVLKADFRRADFATAVAGPLFMMRHLGAGQRAAERARLGLAFLRDGRHAAESMLTNHWLAADGLAARLGVAQQVRDCVEQTFERWDGRGAPRGIRGEEILLTSRLVCLADVTEVYHRAAGAAAAVSVARERSGTQFDPAVVELFAAHAGPVLDGLDDGSTWQAVIDAEPGLAIRLDESGTRRGARSDRRLHRREVAVHDRPLPWRRGPGRGSGPGRRTRTGGRAPGAAGRPRARPRAARRSQHDLGQEGNPEPHGSRAGPHASLPHGADAGRLARARPARRRRRPAPRAARRVRLPPRDDRVGAAGRGTAARRRRLLPCEDRAPPVPGRRQPRRGSGRGAGRGPRWPPRRGRGHRGADRGRAPGCPANRPAIRADWPRGRGTATARGGAVKQGDRRAAGHLAQDRQPPRRAHLCQDRDRQPGHGQPLRRHPRPHQRPARSRVTVLFPRSRPGRAGQDASQRAGSRTGRYPEQSRRIQPMRPPSVVS